MSDPIATHIRRALDPAALADAIAMNPDSWQAEVLRSSNPRILLNCARQSGKSEIAALLSVHTAVFQRESIVLLLSPSQRQSVELFRRVLAIYRGLGRPVVAESENALSLSLENGSRVIALPSTEQTVRGYSKVALLCVDEASRVPDDIMAAIRPMLAVSSGRIIALSTPAGQRGWWYDAWSGRDDWLRVSVTADENPRITAEFLEAERSALGDALYRQEYECEFLGSAPHAAFDPDSVEAAFRHDPNYIPLKGNK